MKWYHYIICFFAGVFLANFVPHFVQGISGNSFPSQFSNPPGKGLSSPTLNVVWGIINLIIGYILLRVGKVTQNNKWNLLTFFIGVVIMSILLSIQFVDKVHQNLYGKKRAAKPAQRQPCKAGLTVYIKFEKKEYLNDEIKWKTII